MTEEENAFDKVKKGVKEVVGGTAGVVEGTAQGIKEAVEDTPESVEDTAEGVKEGVEDTAEGVKETAREATDTEITEGQAGTYNADAKEKYRKKEMTET